MIALLAFVAASVLTPASKEVDLPSPCARFNGSKFDDGRWHMVVDEIPDSWKAKGWQDQEIDAAEYDELTAMLRCYGDPIRPTMRKAFEDGKITRGELETIRTYRRKIDVERELIQLGQEMIDAREQFGHVLKPETWPSANMHHDHGAMPNMPGMEHHQ